MLRDTSDTLDPFCICMNSAATQHRYTFDEESISRASTLNQGHFVTGRDIDGLRFFDRNALPSEATDGRVLYDTVVTSGVAEHRRYAIEALRKLYTVHSIGDLLTTCAETYGNRIALVDQRPSYVSKKAPAPNNQQKLTYREVDRLTEEYALNLIRYGVEEGEKIGVLTENSPQMLLYILACMRAGVVAVPWPSDQNEWSKRGAAGLEHLQVDRVLFSGSDKYSAEDMRDDIAKAYGLSANKMRSLVLGMDSVAHGVALPPIVRTENAQQVLEDRQQRIDCNTPAMILCTTGSSGEPKPVVLTHGNLLHPALTSPPLLSNGPGSVGFVALPFYHAYGFETALTLLSSGAQVHVAAGKTVLKQVEQYRMASSSSKSIRHMDPDTVPPPVRIQPEFMITIPEMLDETVKGIRAGLNNAVEAGGRQGRYARIIRDCWQQGVHKEAQRQRAHMDHIGLPAQDPLREQVEDYLGQSKLLKTAPPSAKWYQSVVKALLMDLCAIPTKRAGLSNMRGENGILIVGGGKTNVDTLLSLRALDVNARIGAGMTENAAIASQPGRFPLPLPLCGETLPGVVMTVIPEDERSVLVCHGPTVAEYADTSLNRHNARIVTGDAGHSILFNRGGMETHGSVSIAGRTKRMVKIQGRIVSLAAIEECLRKSPVIDRVHAVDRDEEVYWLVQPSHNGNAHQGEDVAMHNGELHRSIANAAYGALMENKAVLAGIASIPQTFANRMALVSFDEAQAELEEKGETLFSAKMELRPVKVSEYFAPIVDELCNQK